MESNDKEEHMTTPSFPSFRLWTCGTFRAERLVEGSNGVYEAIRTVNWGGSSYPRLLLKALLCCSGRRARREALVEMLWPETDPEQATQYINTATTKLRKVLEPHKGHASLLLTEDDYKHYLLQGQQSLWVDVDEALTLLKEAESMERTSHEALPRLEQAAQYLNQGTFLDGEEGLWVAGKRATLERVRYRCRLWLAEAYEQQGMPGQAEMVITTLVEEDPLDEDALCRLMELLHRQGMTHKALRLYEQSVQRFDEELGAELNPSTIALVNRLREQQNETDISASSLTHMVQLPKTSVQKAAFVEQSVFMTSKNSISFPLALSLSALSLETTSIDLTTSFGIRINELKAIGAFWYGSTATCQQQQAFIHAEIETWIKMADQDHQTTNEYLISRRMALVTLATLSTTLLTKMQLGRFTTVLVEEFLAASTTSVVACWHLLRGDGLATVEYAIPKYLPLLITLVKQYPPYAKKASYLASQCFLLFSLVALHRLHFSDRVDYCKRAVALAKESGDLTLLVVALTHLGDAFFTNGQPIEMLHIYQQAEQYSRSTEISAFLRSKVMAELAHAYAQQGQNQHVFRSLDEARTTFSEESNETPVFLSTDYGLFQLILFEGLSILGLGNYKEMQKDSSSARDYFRDASNKLRQIEHLSQTIIVPERIRVEIVNHRSLVAVKAGSLEEFEKYLLLGAQGAKALNSEKRQQEVLTNWKVARERWAQEKSVLELADMLF